MIAMSPTAAWSIWLAVLAVCAALSFLFSGMETGVYVMNKIRLDLRAENGQRSAQLLQKLTRRPGNLLAVLLIGITVVEYGVVFAVSMLFVLAGYGEQAQWYTLAVATPLLFVFCESIPKNIFQRLAERLVYSLAWLLGASNWLLNCLGLAPLVRAYSHLLNRFMEPGKNVNHAMGHEGLAVAMAESQAAGLLTHFQSIMADRIMHIARVRLADVMIPMPRVLRAPRDIRRDSLIALTRDHPYSRVPLMNADGQVAGIVSIFDVLLAAESVRPQDVMTEPLLLTAHTAVNDALVRMQQRAAAMAIVHDRAGRHVGLVTMKDLVEEIVGELEAW